jgi:1-acyl-sn-glycerol-3-phosphate acyltransferase
VIRARNAENAELCAPDFAAMGWLHPMDSARSWVGTVAEAALIELDAGVAHDASCVEGVRGTVGPVREKGSLWIGLFALVFYPATWLLARRAARGLKNIPMQGGALLILNHPSYLDPMVDAIFLHEYGRIPRYFTKHTLWNIPLFGRVLDGAGQIPVFRGTSKAGDSLRAGHAALQAGKVVVIYPEGTLSGEDGWPTDGRTGVARLALANDVPIIPAARWGTRAILDSGRRRFRPFPRKPVRILVGEPMDLSAYRDREVDGDLLREVTEVIMAELRNLLKELRD